MHIALAHERFVFRFGVDRVLLMLARGLRAKGHRVTLMANRLDEAIAGQCADRVILVPEPQGRYYESNEHAAAWLEENWDALFGIHEPQPDVVLVGGWPFFNAIRAFKRRGVPVVFMDYGVVPLEGYSGGQLLVLEKVKRLRSTYLPHCSAIVAGSGFIERSQSRIDAPIVPGIQTIWCGADHLSQKLWQFDKAHLAPGVAGKTPLETIEELKASGTRVLVNLGRWEAGCYKNSDALFPLMREINARMAAKCLVLAREEDIDRSADPQQQVLPIGFPDDDDMQAVMAAADLGVSVSLWEGFNLPLAEMQALRRPAVAFDIGAHPEVIAHPWFLCRTLEEMAGKAVEVLQGGGPPPEERERAYAAFDRKFPWSRVVDRYEVVLAAVATRGAKENIRVLIDVSNAARDAANSGVIRVTRRAARELQEACDPLFVVWDREATRYVFPTAEEYRILGTFNGPLPTPRLPVSPSPQERIGLDEIAGSFGAEPAWLLLTETVLEEDGREIRAVARSHGMRIAAVFYDAIAVLRPELVQDHVIRDNHERYMRGLAETDLVVPISEYSAESLRQLWSRWGLAGPAVLANPLPGELTGRPRETRASPLGTDVSILCVSTLEPRKNHRALIEAFRAAAAAHPQVGWTLTLIGNRYAGGEDIADYVQRACAEDPRIRWLGIASDEALAEAYRRCTFTVYASEIEGFGLPIMESLWHGKPCICHAGGVMAELARGGGCLVVDVTDAAAFAVAIARLAQDRELYDRLCTEALTRPIKLWSEYAAIFWRMLVERSGLPEARRESEGMAMTDETLPANHDGVLYPDCLVADWQMNDSERLAMAAILQRLKPRCAIEIGTYKGGSLSLLRQFATSVFSIDIDPEIPGKFGHFENVTFLTGRSQELLPILLDELDSAGVPVSFVLIDGDHSAEGVRKDIELMLDYVPKVPMIVVMHDGFNPECRKGMLEARWARSPYVHFVDVDFIPGRVIEHGGGGDGEMWGGLAFAYFSPRKREAPLRVGASAQRNFEWSLQAARARQKRVAPQG